MIISPIAGLCGPKYLRGIKEPCDGDPSKGIECACSRQANLAAEWGTSIDETPRERDGVIVTGPPS
jgi:hypothetical protein